MATAFQIVMVVLSIDFPSLVVVVGARYPCRRRRRCWPRPLCLPPCLLLAWVSTVGMSLSPIGLHVICKLIFFYLLALR